MFKLKADEYGWQKINQFNNHRYLLPEIRKVLLDIQPKKILDFGCGDGRFTRQISELGFDITGCDIDATGIQIAAQKNEGIFFFNCKKKTL